MTKRVYATEEQIREWPDIHTQWLAHIKEHNAIVLMDGENPTDYPNHAVAFESPNFGWVLSRPDINGNRSILVKF